MWRLVLFSLIILTCSAAMAQYRAGARRPEAARIVVSNYCRMDYEGLRLDQGSWPRMKALTTWRDNPDWQGFTLVSQYELLTSDEGIRGASVTVNYTVLGHFEIGLGYTAEPQRQEVLFRLKDVDNAWKIDDLDPAIDPHVSKARALAWLKAKLETEKDAANRIALEKALKELGVNKQ